MENKNRKSNVLLVLGFVLLIGLVGGLTYAFFNYTRTGSANVLKVGRISFISRQEETINLTNAFPIASSDVDIDTDNIGLLEIEIEGDTDYVNGLEYLITVTNANISTSGKVLPISLDVDIDDLGEENNNYFTARNSKNATIYKRLSGDSIVGDQMLLVGYIMPNSVTGTIEGIDGSITIKAYLDKDKIAISDTFDGIETDYNGTTGEWVDNRVVLTTAEWNALQTTGISFQIKVEANEGIWVDEPIYNVMRMNAVMDNISSSNVTSNTGIDFSKISGDNNNDNVIDNGEGLYVRAGTENDAYPVVYYRGDVDNNNVYFAGKCWQIIRTTDTGGIKMIYNGENTGTTDAPACEPQSGTDRQITLNISGTDTNIFKFSNDIDSIAYSGYMYNTPEYELIYDDYDYESGAKFGNDVIWDGNNYTLTDVSDTLDEYHHYTCIVPGATTCSSVKFYYAYYKDYGENFYINYVLTSGKKIDDVVKELSDNGTNESIAKSMVEQWYEENIAGTVYNSKIEDAVYCNDRSIIALGGMNPNGGILTKSTKITYSGQSRNTFDSNPSTKCSRIQDSFTVAETNGNGLLDYPLGLITIDEIIMAGGSTRKSNADYYLYTGADYWTMSPFSIDRYGCPRVYVNSSFLKMEYVPWLYGLRPVISLKHETSILSGDGTPSNPFTVS